MNKFIVDYQRKFALNGIHSHIKRGDSVLIVGDYGSGKTELLKQIKTSGKAVRIYHPSGTADQLLKKMTKPTAKGYESKIRDRMDLEDELCKRPRTIIIDEAGDMTKTILPSLKAIMDSGSPIIMAGKPDFFKYLTDQHEDILSRLTVIPLSILGESDMRAVATDFTDDAFTAIHFISGNMRKMAKVIKNCREYAKEQGISPINSEVVNKFLDEIDPGSPPKSLPLETTEPA